MSASLSKAVDRKNPVKIMIFLFHGLTEYVREFGNNALLEHDRLKLEERLIYMT